MSNLPPAPFGDQASVPYPRTPGPSRLTRYAIIGLVAGLIAVYAVVAILTRSSWLGSTQQPRTDLVFAAQPSDGSPPSADALAKARQVISARVAALGSSGADVTVDGTELKVSALADGDEVSHLGGVGQLDLRPVIHVIPAQPPNPPLPRKAPTAGSAQQISDERELRQSTDQQLQVLALQFQASRCADDDALAGNDDPKLPLITCASDGAQVYLLGPATVGGDQVAKATARHDEVSGRNGVVLALDDAGAKQFARFTAANVGAQLAYTVDSLVVSAPVIQEPISDGVVQLLGGFTPAQARALASTLANGPLPFPLTVESSNTKMVAVQVGWTPTRIALVGCGVVLALVAIGATVYLARTRAAGRPG